MFNSKEQSKKRIIKNFIETTVIPELERRRIVNLKCACYSSEAEEELEDIIIWFKKNFLNDKSEVSGTT